MPEIPKMMQAAYISDLGEAENIHIGQLSVPAIGPTDVLVQVESLAANPVDAFVRSGAYKTPIPFPFIVGRDCVGTVAAKGEGVTDFYVGDRVWCNSLGHAGRQGPFAEYAAVSAERLYHLPQGVDPDYAAAVFHPAVTAWLGLYRHAHIQAGETIYVGGGAGNVGTAAIQLAAAAGARVIASARPEDFEWCKQAGAADVIDYRTPRLFEQIRDLSGDGLDIYWDTSGKHQYDQTADLLKMGGRIILMAGLMAQSELTAGKLYTRDASIVGFALSNASSSDLAAAAQTINRLLAEQTWMVRISEECSLSDVPEIHRRFEGKSSQGAVRGRIVIHP